VSKAWWWIPAVGWLSNVPLAVIDMWEVSPGLTIGSIVAFIHCALICAFHAIGMEMQPIDDARKS